MSTTQIAATHVLVEGFPFPPSENELRVNGLAFSKKFGKNIARQRNSDTYVRYKAECETWRLQRLRDLAHIRKAVATWPYWEVQAFYVMAGTRFLLKDGSPKQFDVSNRDKALHDCIAPMLGVDDRIFFRVSGEKVLRNLPGEDYVNLLFSPVKMRSAEDLADHFARISVFRLAASR